MGVSAPPCVCSADRLIPFYMILEFKTPGRPRRVWPRGNGETFAEPLAAVPAGMLGRFSAKSLEFDHNSTYRGRFWSQMSGNLERRWSRTRA